MTNVRSKEVAPPTPKRRHESSSGDGEYTKGESISTKKSLNRCLLLGDLGKLEGQYE